MVNIIEMPATKRYESGAIAGLSGKTIYEMNRSGHGVILGGGNLYENGEIDVDVESLKALDIPLMVYSVSRGEFLIKEMSWLIEQMLFLIQNSKQYHMLQNLIM